MTELTPWYSGANWMFLSNSQIFYDFFLFSILFISLSILFIWMESLICWFGPRKKKRLGALNSGIGAQWIYWKRVSWNMKISIWSYCTQWFDSSVQILMDGWCTFVLKLQSVQGALLLEMSINQKVNFLLIILSEKNQKSPAFKKTRPMHLL